MLNLRFFLFPNESFHEVDKLQIIIVVFDSNIFDFHFSFNFIKFVRHASILFYLINFLSLYQSTVFNYFILK